ncbi:16S rRNA (cytosine(1402)-N(4))-methyltransferase RsmH [Candidatus Babeliales bacterium]|nr:16S rRNA (cytosine(1402)-N(4))-methyltransferase RsmH [Candidatus Babeliales bacterium]
MEQEIYHKSVLTKEVIEALNIKPGGLYVDATFGGGGHTRAILQAEPTAKVFAIDWDQTAIETNAPAIEKEFGNRFKIAWSNFARLGLALKKEKISSIDGILADFGTSQFQLQHKRGFSFQHETPLDMRMSPAHQRITATHVINSFNERKLAEIFFELGEERHARSIAKTIVAQRQQEAIKTTKQLADLVASLTPAYRQAQKRTHPATKVFQALRIFINKELENIEIFLKAALTHLAPGGRIVCISFHSLEDRIVKHFFKENEVSLEILTKKPIVPSQEEVGINPSSRSAKLRVGAKK